MTSHPKDLSPRLIEAMATLPKVCNHIHLPVQSGSNRILSEMNRRYTREKYLGLVEDIRAAVDGVELTTDIIVGFPGETEEDFEETLALVRQVGFSAAYTFMYSPRLGTRAAEMENQVPEEVKKDRLLRLNACSAEQLKVGNQKYIGQEGTVLVEDVYKRQVLSIVKHPAFSSHTNARAVCPHKRSLSDEHIRAIAESGGVVCVNYYPPQLCRKGEASIADIVRHILHVAEVGGLEHVALGSDFDGMSEYPRDLKNWGDVPRLLDALLHEGLSEAEVRHIAYDNLRDYIARFY